MDVQSLRLPIQLKGRVRHGIDDRSPDVLLQGEAGIAGHPDEERVRIAAHLRLRFLVHIQGHPPGGDGERSRPGIVRGPEGEC